MSWFLVGFVCTAPRQGRQDESGSSQAFPCTWICVQVCTHTLGTPVSDSDVGVPAEAAWLSAAIRSLWMLISSVKRGALFGVRGQSPQLSGCPPFLLSTNMLTTSICLQQQGGHQVPAAPPPLPGLPGPQARLLLKGPTLRPLPPGAPLTAGLEHTGPGLAPRCLAPASLRPGLRGSPRDVVRFWRKEVVLLSGCHHGSALPCPAPALLLPAWRGALLPGNHCDEAAEHAHFMVRTLRPRQAGRWQAEDPELGKLGLVAAESAPRGSEGRRGAWACCLQDASSQVNNSPQREARGAPPGPFLRREAPGALAAASPSSEGRSSRGAAGTLSWRALSLALSTLFHFKHVLIVCV